MTRGNNRNGKHDGWEFSGLNIAWVRTILDGIGVILGVIGLSWVRIFRVGIVRVGVILGGNFPGGGNCPGGVILGGNFPGGNCPGGSYPGWEFS